MRRIHAPLLAAGVLLRRVVRSAAARQDLGRGSRRVSRPERRGRPVRAALPASRHLARIRTGRREGHTLLLPWLAVRRRWYPPWGGGRGGRKQGEGQGG